MQSVYIYDCVTRTGPTEFSSGNREQVQKCVRKRMGKKKVCVRVNVESEKKGVWEEERDILLCFKG